MLLTCSGNINGLLIPSNPRGLHEKKLYIHKNTWKNLFCICGKISKIFSWSTLLLLTKRSDLSYYWIYDTSIIRRLSRSQMCDIKAIGLYFSELFHPLRSVHVSLPSILLCNHLSLSRHTMRAKNLNAIS